MGILFLPVILVALVCFIGSVVEVYRLVKRKDTVPTDFLFGFLISIIIYGVITADYASDGRYWALGPYFTFPIFTIILPSFIAMLMKEVRNSKIKRFAYSLLINVLFSGVIYILFTETILIILENNGVVKHY